MNTQPMISVIIPVYNAEAYLRCCLDSVLAQTYGNFELLLVDDGSTDASPEICDDYARRDARVRAFHQKNAGQAAARNFGLDNMRGTYIAFLDSDDFVHREYLAQLLRACLEQGAQVAIGDFREVTPEDGLDLAAEELPAADVICMTGAEANFRLFGKDNQKTIWLYDKLIRADMVGELRIPDWRVHEDTAFTYRYLYFVPKVAYTSAALLFYRVNPESIMHGRFSDKFFSILPILDEQTRFYLERGEHALAAQAAGTLCWYCMDYYKKTLHADENTAERKRRLKRALRRLCKTSFAIHGVPFKRRAKYLLVALAPEICCRVLRA